MQIATRRKLDPATQLHGAIQYDAQFDVCPVPCMERPTFKESEQIQHYHLTRNLIAS